MKKTLIIFTTALVSLISFSQVPNYVPTNGLVGYWPFNGNANDESGNGNVGVSTNIQFSSDRLGNPLSSALFDGVSSNIAFPASSVFQPTSYTISAWFKTSIIQYGSLFNPLGQTIVCYSPLNWDQGPAYKAWLWTTDNSILSSRQWIAAPAWEDINTSPNTINVNEWRHCVMTFDQSTNNQKLYIDGQLYGTLNSVLEYNNQVNFIIGASKENSAGTICNVFNGNLDDIGFWNRALTQCEIADLYNAQLGSLNSSSTVNETALDSYTWPLNNQTYTQSGTYSDTLINAAGCDSIVTLNLSLNFTGLNEQENTISIAPNPATDQLTISSSSSIDEKYILFDPQGRSVLSGKLSGTTTQLDLSKLARGNYLLQIGEKKTPVKLVKQ
jgi:hypothetical protein